MTGPRGDILSPSDKILLRDAGPFHVDEQRFRIDASAVHHDSGIPVLHRSIALRMLVVRGGEVRL
jgi:hypothetical protein